MVRVEDERGCGGNFCCCFQHRYANLYITFNVLSQGKILGRWETANKSPIYNSDAVISNRAQNCPVPWYVNGCVMDEDLS